LLHHRECTRRPARIQVSYVTLRRSSHLVHIWFTSGARPWRLSPLRLCHQSERLIGRGACYTQASGEVCGSLWVEGKRLTYSSASPICGADVDWPVHRAGILWAHGGGPAEANASALCQAV